MPSRDEIDRLITDEAAVHAGASYFTGSKDPLVIGRLMRTAVSRSVHGGYRLGQADLTTTSLAERLGVGIAPLHEPVNGQSFGQLFEWPSAEGPYAELDIPKQLRRDIAFAMVAQLPDHEFAQLPEWSAFLTAATIAADPKISQQEVWQCIVRESDGVREYAAAAALEGIGQPPRDNLSPIEVGLVLGAVTTAEYISREYFKSAEAIQ
jgi:hypothetical protein